MQTAALIIFAIVNIPLAIVVIRNNSKSWTNRLFSLLVISLTIYLVVNAQVYQFGDYATRLFFARFIMANAAILNILVFLFLATFPDITIPIKKKFVYASLIITIPLSIVALFTSAIFKSIAISAENTVVPENGVLIPLFGIHTVVFIIAGIYFVFRKWRKSEGVNKQQISYILMAFGILFFLILIFNFLLPVVFKIGTFVPFLPIYILFFLGFVSYSIVKHGLFDIRVVATEALVLIIWLILLWRIFISTNNTDRIIDIFVFIGMVIFGVFLVRSVRREIEQRKELALLNDKLKELDQRKNEFLSMASHELRAPMTAIKGYLSMLIEGDAGEIPEKARGFLTDASAVTERLIRLVNNMLNVSRIEENRMVFQVEKVHLSEVARTVAAEFKGEAVRKNLAFELKEANDVKDEVVVDGDRVHEVVANLVSNAIKYTETGTVTLELSQPNPTTVRFDIKDTGMGITPDEQVKLFKKFARAESAVGKTVGTGLGLYISKLLVEKFGGRIGLMSEFGKGSDFWFELPLAGTLEHNPPGLEMPPAANAKPAEKVTVSS